MPPSRITAIASGRDGRSTHVDLVWPKGPVLTLSVGEARQVRDALDAVLAAVVDEEAAEVGEWTPHLTRDDIRRLAGCPTCDALIGEPCIFDTPKRAGRNHHARMHAAQLVHNASRPPYWRDRRS